MTLAAKSRRLLKVASPRVILFLALCLAAPVTARDVYVSPQGRDSDPGTEAKPVATLEAGRDLMRKQNHRHPAG